LNRRSRADDANPPQTGEIVLATGTLSRSIFVSFVLAAVAAFLLTSSAGAQAPATGRVRVMHASPDAPAVDIFVDGAKAVTGLTFPKDTGYVSLPAGSHNVKVFASPSDGTGTPVLQADLNVVANKDYTVLAVGRLSDSTLALLPLEDNNATPAAGKAHVRLIHASPDAPAVDVTVAGGTPKIFSNVAFKGVGTYTPVAAGAYSLDVRTTSNNAVVKTVPLTLSDRFVYTAVAVGLAGNGTLQVVALVDAQAPAPGVPHTGTGLDATSSNGTDILFAASAAALLAVGGAGMTLAVRRSR
jgi:hypothetical protein